MKQTFSSFCLTNFVFNFRTICVLIFNDDILFFDKMRLSLNWDLEKEIKIKKGNWILSVILSLIESVLSNEKVVGAEA